MKFIFLLLAVAFQSSICGVKSQGLEQPELETASSILAVLTFALSENSEEERIFRCFGALISTKFVVLPAICLYTSPLPLTKDFECKNNSLMKMSRMRLMFNINSKSPVQHGVSSIMVHPQFAVDCRLNNIALTLLKKSISENNPNIRPVNISSFVSTNYPFWMECYAVGFTVTRPRTGMKLYVSRLRFVLWDDATIRGLVQAKYCYPQDILCMQILDSCILTPGSPLVCGDNNLLLGVFEPGETECSEVLAYFNVARFHSWLVETMATLKGGRLSPWNLYTIIFATYLFVIKIPMYLIN